MALNPTSHITEGIIMQNTNATLDSATLARHLIDAAVRRGGITAYPDGTTPSSGYVVGIAGRGAIIDMSAPHTVMLASAWLDATLPTLSATECFGSWFHNGDVYLDVSVVIANRDAALAVARATGEMAIWDIDAGIAVLA